MRNLFKKALAFCLVAALALTCFAGTFYAAEPYTATISVDSKTITLGTETVDVVLNISSPAAGINEALFKVSSDLGTVTAVDVAEDDIAIIDYATNDGETVSDYGSFYLSAKNTSDGENGTVLGSINAATITVTFAVAAGVGEYPINIETSGVKAASKDEDVITLSYETANVIVEEEATECEHAWEYVTATPAEGTGTSATNQTTTKVGSITLKCALCEVEETNDVQYYGRTKCFTANAVYQSAIQLEFSARKDRLIEKGQYDDAFVRFEHILSDGTLKETSQKVADGADTVKNSRDSKTWAYSVKAMQLTEEISTVVFVEIDDVWYSGEAYVASVRTYADSILPLATVTDTERALVVNMLRYGSKMQVYKNYSIDKLADADLPAEYAAMIIESDPVIEGAPSKDDTIGNDCVQILSSFQLFMDSRTEVKFRVRSDRYTAEPAKDDFVIVASWDSARGDQRSATFYNEAYATGDDLTYGQDSQSANAGRWEFRFGECSAYDFRQTISFNIYDPDDMNTDISQKYSASFESLLSSGISQGLYGAAELAMYKAMMNYSDAARAHFCK